MKKEVKESAVIVTTAHRGVFFGYAASTDGETVRLRDARLCIYWSADMMGFMGLAAKGPSKTCKIGPRANITLRNITAVLEVPEAAIERWESFP
jgi:hypothetical protein